MKDSKNVASIQFIRGESIKAIPEIRIYRSKDGKKGKAIFSFKKTNEISDDLINTIKEMVMKDSEGEIVTRNINIHILEEKQKSIEAIYSWQADIEFQRFIRFVNTYSKQYKAEESKT